MTQVHIWVEGCDDSTSIVIDVDPSLVPILEDIAKKITDTSTYGCEPTMSITELNNDRATDLE